MSGRGGGGAGGKGSNGISAIPTASRKMVQSLKEIVNNCTEQEIYAALKDCNMDPNEAVNRLLSQDPFHEVKSKREKKKENKDTPDLRPRGANSASSRGSKGGAERYVGRGGTNQFSSTESGSLYGKPAYKKENGSHTYAAGSSSSGSNMAGNNMSRRPSSYSESVGMENKVFTMGTSNGISSPTQPSGLQSPWLGIPGHVSMADIVKMGRPHGKASTVPNPPIQNVDHQNFLATSSAATLHNLHPLQDHTSSMSEMIAESGVATSQHLPPEDEWPAIEQPAPTNLSSVVEGPPDSELYADPSNLTLDRGNQHTNNQLDEVRVADDLAVGPTSVSNRHIQEENSGGASVFDNSIYEDMNSYQHDVEHNEAEDGISSVATNLQQLNLLKDDLAATPEEDNPPVIIPNHLQLHSPDCLNLSFGSFGSGTGAAFSGSGTFASRPLKTDLEETSTAADVSSIGHSDSRKPEYYGDEHLGSNTDGSLVHRTGVSTSNYDSPSVSQPEVLKQETPEVAHGNQYTFPSSAPDFTYESTQQYNTSFTHPQTSSQMQNLSSFSSVMQQGYTNSLPSTLLASTVQTAREDLPYSPFPVTQSMPSKYANVASSISGPTISMPEALGAVSISTPQPTPQTLPGASVATGPAIPQHLAVHPYSQPTLPLGHFANMIGYPFLPQSYTYMPSAFQQAFAGNNTYHQSLAAVLPQYKNSVSVSSLPQSAAIASGYAFGSSTSIPGGNFPLNAPTAPTGTTVGYEDVLSSQYKDSNHLMSLQQNDNSAMWLHGPGSRTVSALPSTYYSFQGQNQQASGYRQGQQQSQHFGALGYANFYHSQTGLSMDHQQQNPRDGSLGGSQGQPSKQSQQIWQNNY